MDIVKITMRVQSPLILSGPLHLDGLLSAVHPAMYNRCKPIRQDMDDAAIKAAPLPLYSIRSSETAEYNWVWAATVAELPETAIFNQDFLTKNWSGEDVREFRMAVKTASGALRNRLITLPVILTPEIYFYCATKSIGELKRLLRRVQSIGGMRRVGYGVVSDWLVEPVELCWQDIIAKNGVARRNLPASFGEGEGVSVNIHPPYWHKTTSKKGTSVGGRISLSQSLVIVE